MREPSWFVLIVDSIVSLSLAGVMLYAVVVDNDDVKMVAAFLSLLWLLKIKGHMKNLK